jgi:hypothetical protein
MFIISSHVFRTQLRSLKVVRFAETCCKTHKISEKIKTFLVLITCIIEYVENDQQNALNYILLIISCGGSYMFRQQLCHLQRAATFILSYLNVNLSSRQVMQCTVCDLNAGVRDCSVTHQHSGHILYITWLVCYPSWRLSNSEWT